MVIESLQTFILNYIAVLLFKCVIKVESLMILHASSVQYLYFLSNSFSNLYPDTPITITSQIPTPLYLNCRTRQPKCSTPSDTNTPSLTFTNNLIHSKPPTLALFTLADPTGKPMHAEPQPSLNTWTGTGSVPPNACPIYNKN